MVALAVATVALVAGAWLGRGLAPVDPGPTLTPATVGYVSADLLVVHVSGWVASPGLVELPGGARLGDAIAAAGGVRPGAALASVNLAQILSDGQQVVVPRPGTGESQVAADGSAPTDGKVRVNQATADELERLPGVGPVLAERIVAHREEMGPFETVEDLLAVSGIGEAKLASIRDFVVVP